MSNIPQSLYTSRRLVHSAIEDLTQQLKKGKDPRLASGVDYYIHTAGSHLIAALKRARGSALIDIEHAKELLLSIGHELMNGHKTGSTINPTAIDDMVRKASDAVAKEAGTLGKLTGAITRNSAGAAGLVGLATLAAACLLPGGKQEEKTNPDGSVETRGTGGFFKTTAVGLGVVLSSVLLAHYLHGKWADKVMAEGAKTLGRF